MDKLKIIEDLKSYITSNNIPVPLTIKEYDVLVKNMKGYSRAWLCKNNIKCAKDILPYLGTEYLDASNNRFLKYSEYANTLGLSIELHDLDTTTSKISQTSKICVKCPEGNFEEIITAHSLMRRTQGCKRCTHQSKWHTRESEFIEICNNKNIRLFKKSFSEISKLRYSKIKLICTKCDNIFERTFANIVEKKYPTNCPVCYPPKVYGKMGTTVYFNNIEFSSEFEVNVYKILLKYMDEKDILIHIPYTRFVNNCNYISDFLLQDNIVLEVSSFNLANHPEYANRIYEKESILQNTDYKFVFCNTLAEVEDLVQSII